LAKTGIITNTQKRRFCEIMKLHTAQAYLASNAWFGRHTSRYSTGLGSVAGDAETQCCNNLLVLFSINFPAPDPLPCWTGYQSISRVTSRLLQCTTSRSGRMHL